MKKWILLGIMAFCPCLAHADLKSKTDHKAQLDYEFGVVPTDNWAYAANQKAVEWVYGNQSKTMAFEPNTEVTRFQFAISIARMEEQLNSGHQLPLGVDYFAVRDVLSVLHREFEWHISLLGKRMG